MRTRKITAIVKPEQVTPSADDRVIDAKGNYVSPVSLISTRMAVVATIHGWNRGSIPRCRGNARETWHYRTATHHPYQHNRELIKMFATYKEAVKQNKKELNL